MNSASIAALAASNAAIVATQSSGGCTEISSGEARLLLAILAASMVISVISAVMAKARDPYCDFMYAVCIGLFVFGVLLFGVLIVLTVMQLVYVAF